MTAKQSTDTQSKKIESNPLAKALNDARYSIKGTNGDLISALALVFSGYCDTLGAWILEQAAEQAKQRAPEIRKEVDALLAKIES